MKTNTWGHVQREWGYEIRVDFTSDDGQIYNEVLTFDTEPTEEEMSVRISSLQSTVEQRIITQDIGDIHGDNHI